MPPACDFIVVNATSLNLAFNGSILGKPTALSAPVDQGVVGVPQVLVAAVKPESNERVE